MKNKAKLFSGYAPFDGNARRKHERKTIKPNQIDMYLQK